MPARTQQPSPYEDELRRIRSLLVVTSLQERHDLRALKLVKAFPHALTWEPLSRLMVEGGIWEYVVNECRYDPKLVFCHPDLLGAFSDGECLECVPKCL